MMAVTDDIIVRVQPVAGDTGIKNLVNNAIFSGVGTPTLVDEGAEKAWQIVSGVSLKTAASHVLATSTDGAGITMLLRFKRVAGTVTGLPMAGMLASGAVLTNGTIFRASTNVNYLGRLGSSTGSAAVSSLPVGEIHTLVYRFECSSTSGSDFGKIWRNKVGRVNNDPDATSTGSNAAAITYVEAFIDASSDLTYNALDFIVWAGQKTDAECAALADNVRSLLPAPSGGTTPIAFAGTIPNQTFTNGDAVSVDLSTYFTGTQTPFSFANTGTALTGTGLTLSSAGLLSGTATTGSVTGVIVTGTDADTNTASSNAFNVAVNAAASPPAGTVTIGTITVTETTATVPYTYSAADQTGFEYRLNGGTPVADAASPVDLTGLTAGTAYTIEVRAVNDSGSGSWSAVGNFTTDAAATPTITLTGLSSIQKVPWASASVTCDVIDPSTGALVVRKTGLTSTAGAAVSFTDAALSFATTYDVVIRIGADSIGIARVTT